jgi:hypothetical protein
MEKLFYKKIKSDYGGRVRFYELTQPLYRGKNGGGREETLTHAELSKWDKFRPEYEYLNEELEKPVKYIAVSDAKYYVERLVFVCVFDRKRNKPVMLSTDIAGKDTFMIHGGDPKSVYRDETYIRWLARYNGYQWGGEIKE